MQIEQAVTILTVAGAGFAYLAHKHGYFSCLSEICGRKQSIEEEIFGPDTAKLKSRGERIKEQIKIRGRSP